MAIIVVNLCKYSKLETAIVQKYKRSKISQKKGAYYMHPFYFVILFVRPRKLTFIIRVIE